jgi:hypothetical protein
MPKFPDKNPANAVTLARIRFEEWSGSLTCRSTGAATIAQRAKKKGNLPLRPGGAAAPAPPAKDNVQMRQRARARDDTLAPIKSAGYNRKIEFLRTQFSPLFTM